jgi:hypothetical protein
VNPDGPLKHIYRPLLPWQTVPLTECGRVASEVEECMTRPETKTLLNKIGRTRLHFVCCVTCVNRANYQVDSWEDDPAGVMSRHCDRGSRRDPNSAISIELRALALLVEAHREEFDQAVTDLGESVSLSALRRERARRARTTNVVRLS